MKTIKAAFCSYILLLLILSAFSGSISAQKIQSKKPDAPVFSIAPNSSVLQTEYSKSSLLSRNINYNVILPFDYNLEKNRGKRYPVIYLLHGLTGNYSNWAVKTELAKYAFQREIIIVMPEGGDGWYTDSRSVAGDKYESYIVEELISEVDKRFRTRAERRFRAVAGLSMGGYGAIKFGLKYPEKFALVGSFSGALDAPLRGQNHPFLRPSIVSVFGEEVSETRKANDIFRLVNEMTDERSKNLPFIYLDCGTEDFLIKTNRDFAALLLEKKIPHEYRQLPGNHNWQYWDKQVREFLELSEKFLSAKEKAKGN